MEIKLYKNDIPDDVDLGKVIAIDTETLGLNLVRDRLCLVQMSSGDGCAHLVQFESGEQDSYSAPNLKAILNDTSCLKLFHYGRFDLAVLKRDLGVMCQPVYCTKIASKIIRTYTDKHGYKDLCSELLNISISKTEQTSDWGGELSKAQMKYAATDVLYLHKIKKELDKMLVREKRMDLVQACFNFIEHRTDLDLEGWAEQDIFKH